MTDAVRRLSATARASGPEFPGSHSAFYRTQASARYSPSRQNSGLYYLSAAARAALETPGAVVLPHDLVPADAAAA